eukprot:Rmarinus@m.7559
MEDKLAFEAEFEKQKAFLKENGLYDLMSQIVLKVVSEKPADAVSQFEDIACAVKRDTYKDPVIHKQSRELTDAATKFLKTQKLLFAPPRDTEDGEEVVDEGEPNDAEIPDIMEELRLFESVGIGFGPQESVKIARAVWKLAEDPKFNLKNVRFFGKILGTEGDYYVAEGELKEPNPPPEEEEDPNPNVVPPEENGKGTNKYNYFVCSYPGAPWVELPDVTPQQIQAARQIVRAFTGDLDSKMATYPPFPGTERHYLRAQLGRIAQATVLVPNGMLNPPNEEEEEITTNDEFEPLTPEDLCTSAGWVHEREFVRLQGRVEKWSPPPPETDDDDGDEPPEEDDTEEVPGILTSAEEDTPIGETPSWVGRLSKGMPAKYAVACLRSMRWPGAYVVGTYGEKVNKFANTYIGTGHKSLGEAYAPPPPPAIEQEFDDTLLIEQPDPSPEEEFPPDDEEGEGDDDEGDED